MEHSSLRCRFYRWWIVCAGVLLLHTPDALGQMVLLPDDRVIVGTVTDIRSDQVQVRLDADDVEPRYLSAKEAQEKGVWPLKKGDRLHIVVNEQNTALGYHRVGDPGFHQIMRGRLAQPLIVDQEWAVVQREGGGEHAYHVRPLIRSKMAGVPIRQPAVFLIDETNQIMDVVFGSEETLRAAITGWHGSPPKSVDRQVRGTLVKPVADNHVTIRTEDGRERIIEFRTFVQDKLAKLRAGESVILLLDGENKVADLAVPPVP
ncbi:MAG TPA: hypothetical protein VJ746_07650 [Nitrospira sp.]|nr:hypothetical protein [Nitrospira sp.]